MHKNCSSPQFRMASRQSSYVHLVAGGIGGTMGAVVTCPLEVVKTRLQASVPVFQRVYCPMPGLGSVPMEVAGLSKPAGIFACLKHIVKTEGPRSLFKGLGPNLVGVAPSRAIYFSIYAKVKKTLNRSGVLSPESKLVHICSACSAGLTTSTLTSPIWVLKTRMQLDSRYIESLAVALHDKRNGETRATQGQQRKLPAMINSILRTDGIKGFYRGLTASYVGVTETCIHFVCYEQVKLQLKLNRIGQGRHQKNVWDFMEFMMAAATSKCIASTIAYPHEVIRTRLRQQEVDGQKRYRNFFQAFKKILLEEGRPGLYGGLGTHLIRQIPNTAIMFLTYESIVSFLCKDDVF